MLADAGHLDVAYTLLFQDTAPSWLAMIDQGATTIWENWEGPDAGSDTGIASLNHYSKGAVISFLHRHVAGLRPDEDHPGYERFTIAPMPGGGLTSAEAVHDARPGPGAQRLGHRGRHLHPRRRGPTRGRRPTSCSPTAPATGRGRGHRPTEAPWRESDQDRFPTTMGSGWVVTQRVPE